MVVYCFPLVDGRTHYPLAKRFAETYRSHPSGYPHELVIGCNGPPPLSRDRALFEGIECSFFQHNNWGWDIGLYLALAQGHPCDLLVCLGAHIQFNHEGWLARLVDAVLHHGPGLYGPWGAPYPTRHIRTTAFACPPELLLAYPRPVNSDRVSRYGFEHGKESFTHFVAAAGFPVYMVTLDGEFPPDQWKNCAPTAERSLLTDKQHR